MTMHRDLQLRNDIVGFYGIKQKEGRGLENFEDCVDKMIRGLGEYIKKSKVGLIIKASNNSNRNDLKANRKATVKIYKKKKENYTDT